MHLETREIVLCDLRVDNSVNVQVIVSTRIWINLKTHTPKSDFFLAFLVWMIENGNVGTGPECVWI